MTLTLIPTTTWQDQAACTDTDPDLFFPPRGVVNIDEARAICNTCPVQQECLEFGLLPENTKFGVWGGTTKTERIRIRRARRAASR